MVFFDAVLWKLALLLLPIFPLGGQPAKFSFMPEVGIGYRVDCADWNIAGIDNKPNILSELTWRDLRMLQLQGDFRMSGVGKLYVRGLADYGWIFHGRNRDSDYNGDDRTDEYMRSDNNSGRGEAFDVLVGVGYPIICFGGLFVSPVGGYSYHEQHLHMYEGKMVINKDHPEMEGKEIPRLESTYDNCWKSPFVGVDVILCLGRLTLLGEWEHHWTTFDGEGHWNLRRDFLDCFKDKAKGDGMRTSVRALWCFKGSFSVGLGVDYWKMQGNEGTSKVTVMSYVVNNVGEVIGRSPTTVETDFNEVNWRSLRVNALISCVF